MSDKVKTLILDLETFPATAFVWGLFKETIPLQRLIKPGSVASWAAKWEGSDITEYSSVNLTSRKKMLKEIWKLLNEADEVVGWNSNSFDLKLLNAEFAIHDIKPPSPYKKVDLMRVAKANMKFVSNKLEHVAGQFNIGHKLSHSGFGLWIRCMEGDNEAWKEFEDYNVQDVLLTERMYYKLLPWITTGLNRSVLTEDRVCPNCGSTHLQSRGFSISNALRYRRYQCRSCGKWSRSKLAEKTDRSAQLVGVN